MEEQYIDPSWECPCPCAECGKWQDQDDMVGSNVHKNALICEACGNKEDQHEERIEDIRNLLNAIEDAEWTLKDSKIQLENMKATPEEIEEAKNKY